MKWDFLIKRPSGVFPSLTLYIYYYSSATLEFTPFRFRLHKTVTLYGKSHKSWSFRFPFLPSCVLVSWEDRRIDIHQIPTPLVLSRFTLVICAKLSSGGADSNNSFQNLYFALLLAKRRYYTIFKWAKRNPNKTWNIFIIIKKIYGYFMLESIF